MTPSMADHLGAQEYMRQHRSTAALLVEPSLTDENASHLVEMYERNETSVVDYLSLATSSRGFTPPSITHAVVIESGSYCSSSLAPVILMSFLHENGNAVVKEGLYRREVAVVEKMASGDVLIHVRTPEVEAKLTGQEITLLGKMFKIKKQSPFSRKFHLDISGVCTMETANALHLGLCDIGARPMYFTPRDVNLDAQVSTPTWRFYFEQEIVAPPCLMVHGFVTNQLTIGGKYYVVYGKRSSLPPERASGFRKSRYSVQLSDSTQLEMQHHRGGRNTTDKTSIAAHPIPSMNDGNTGTSDNPIDQAEQTEHKPTAEALALEVTSRCGSNEQGMDWMTPKLRHPGSLNRLNISQISR
ncbi:hypothetical protein ON010_g7998 [Phytophthora cinnamomi]|nr:hypothetical protein ON010_g7998 [Phytophthora cinnamomi]